MSGFAFGASGAVALLILWMSWSRTGELALAVVKGFDPPAWVAPLAVLGAALLGTILLVRRWSCNKTQTGPEVSDPALDALKQKIRRETESGNDGGF
jgi:H+/Cl- antiporter ClcA